MLYLYNNIVYFLKVYIFVEWFLLSVKYLVLSVKDDVENRIVNRERDYSSIMKW